MAKSSPKRSLIAETKSAALARNTARLAELLAIIRRRMTEVVEGFYDLGEALREMLETFVVETTDPWGTRALNAERPSAGRASERACSIVRSWGTRPSSVPRRPPSASRQQERTRSKLWKTRRRLRCSSMFLNPPVSNLYTDLVAEEPGVYVASPTGDLCKYFSCK